MIGWRAIWAGSKGASLRAERRVGQLLKQQEKAKGTRGSGETQLRRYEVATA